MTTWSAIDGTDFEARCDGRWVTLRDRDPHPRIGGPWKPARCREGRFGELDLPTLLEWDETYEQPEAIDSHPSSRIPRFRQLLPWIEASARGEVPSDWQPPPRARIEAWVSPDRLSVRSAEQLARGEILCSPDRLAVAFADLVRVPDELPRARRLWMRELLLDAQERFRLVRSHVGCAPESPGLEIDLTGVPSACARSWLCTSLEILATAVRSLLVPLRLVTDPVFESAALCRAPSRASSRNQEKHHARSP